jgi:hypothetical protein
MLKGLQTNVRKSVRSSSSYKYITHIHTHDPWLFNKKKNEIVSRTVIFIKLKKKKKKRVEL